VYDGANIRSGNKDDGYSVRCVMDVEPEIIEPPVIIVPEAKACKTETKDECEYGLLTDSRDKQTYKTVKIGSQIWMAENLNFETDSSYCFNDSAKYCSKYGRLYTWAAAMDSAGVWSENGKGCGYQKMCTPTYPVQGACPSGWHLPTKAEYDTLFAAIGGSETAGVKLKSTSGWSESGNGTDDYSFSAVPTGYRFINGIYPIYSGDGYLGFLWTSTEAESDEWCDETCRRVAACIVSLNSLNDDSFVGNMGKEDAYPVRCVKD